MSDCLLRSSYSVDLSATYAENSLILCHNNGVGLGMLDDLHCENHIFKLLFCGLSLRNDFALALVNYHFVVFLHQKTAENFLHIVTVVGNRLCDFGKLQKTDISLLFEYRKRFLRKIGSNNYLDENLAYLLCRILVYRTVGSDYSSEDRSGVCRIRLEECFAYRLCRSNTARVSVFYCYYRGLAEFSQKIERTVCIVDVVVRKFFAVKLDCRCKRTFYVKRFLIEYGFLMRILTVSHILRLVECHGEFLGEFDTEFLTQIVGNQSIVIGSMLIYLVHEIEFCLFGDTAVGKFVKYLGIVLRVYHNSYVLIVLCRTSEHRRSADINVFDRRLQIYTGFFDGFLERIEVDYDNVDRVNVHLLEEVHMFLVVSHCKKTCVYLGVQSLYSAVETLGKSRDGRYVNRLNTRLVQYLERAARGYYFITERSEFLCKIYYTRFIGYADKCFFCHFYPLLYMLACLIISVLFYC